MSFPRKTAAISLLASLLLISDAAWSEQPAPIPVIGALLDLSSAKPTLAAKFDELPKFAGGHAEPIKKGGAPPRFDDPAFEWRAGYVNTKLFKSIKQPPWIPSGRPYPGFAWINHERASYPNHDAIVALGLDVIGVSDGALELRAMPAPDNVLRELPEGMETPFISGAINSFPFAQAGGYFEIDALLPAMPGIWPAFWLLPADNTWPPEIDVFELLGKDPTTIYASLHFFDRLGKKAAVINPVKIADPSKAYHTYGVEWDRDYIRWYVDRILVHFNATPDGLKDRPMYLLANVAVGGPNNWGGATNEKTRFPAVMKIRHLRVWELGR